MESGADVPDRAGIRAGLLQIIGEASGESTIDAPSLDLPDDTPILDLVVSSLALVDGMRRVYERFGVLVSIRRVLEGHATLGGIAALIEQELQTPHARAREAAARTPEDDLAATRVPFVPSQRHVGFLVRYSSEAAAAYNEALAVDLDGPFDAQALQAALDLVTTRYEALRTSLSQEADALLIHAGARTPLVVSPSTVSSKQGRLTESVRRPFAPGERLFRAELLRESDRRHTLLLVSHALVMDRDALYRVLTELAAAYVSFSADEKPAPVFPALQWTDYLAMGEAPIVLQARSDAASFWRRTLSPPPPVLALPTDGSRPPVKRYAGDRVRLPLDVEVMDLATRQAAAIGVSVADVVFGAWSLFLGGLAGQDEVVVGVGSQPLYFDEEQPVVGQTRTMLPVRVDVDRRRPFAEHLRNASSAVRQAQDHRSLSLGELIQLADLPRDQSRSPLFVSAFEHRARRAAPPFGALVARVVDAPASGARYDLDLAIVHDDDCAELVCEFSTELFAPDTVAGWLRGVAALLEHGVRTPDVPCATLSAIGAVDRTTVLVDWNRTDVDFARDRTVLDLFAERAATQPNLPAVTCGDDAWTYAQLLDRVEAIAAHLRRVGVTSGDRVSVLLERSPDLVAALLAVWRAGAAYVPLDARFPAARLAYMVEDAEVRTCVTSLTLRALLPEDLAGRAVCVEDVPPRVARAAALHVAPAERAYVIYTSGSTGRPKGVEVRHESLVNCLQSVRASIDFGSTDTLLALTTPSFDISTVELFLPLIAGGVVDLAPDDVVADGVRLAELFAARRPTHVQATPSTWRAILAGGWAGDRRLCACSGGESLGRELAEQLLDRCRALYNLYGPTETTVWSAACEVTSAPGAAVPVGRPLANTQLYVLDDERAPVPVGAVGELYIGGTGLAVGYWRRPELTAERFVSHPFRPGERLYRTGDLVRYQSDGQVVCLGRLDDQVKIHGVRVELGDVETALRALPGVADAVVTTWRDARGDNQLVAHVIRRRGVTVSASELRAGLRDVLPNALIPPFVRFADAFPSTANGKVLRAALPPPDAATAGGTSRPEEPPATRTERVLAEAWGRVLGIEPAVVGRDSRFTELGGHSLLLTPLMIEVRRSFDVNLALRDFFDAPTLRAFAALVDEHRAAAPGDAAAARTAARRRDWGRERMATLVREAQLPPSLVPARGLTYEPPPRIERVLLTGATGFLGAYVLAEILRTTEAEIHCLVRTRLGQDGRDRIERQMRGYAVWRGDQEWLSAWRSRVHVVEGDVTLPRLGMASGVYESLARSIDAIVHGAAHVNFIYPYEALRATNVLGVHEIIRFAFHARVKPVHHLSTAAIWPMGAQFTFYEKDSIDHGELLNLGYDEAKWVGERCLLHAADRGLPVARYRPGEVGGDSVTGRSVTDHFLIACIKGFLQFGAFPSLDIELDVAPVDYVARAMTHMVFHGDPLGRAFHLTNPGRMHMSEALAFLRAQGYAFEELRFESLRDRLLRRPDFGANALFAYQAVLEEMDDVSLELPTYDTRETERALDGSGIVCPRADERLFGRYFEYLRRIGYMPEPAGLATATPSPH